MNLWNNLERDKLGWERQPSQSQTPEAPGDVQLRNLVTTGLGRFGDPAVLAGAADRFKRFLEDPETLKSAELKTVVTTVVGYGADATTYDRLHRLGLEAKQRGENHMIYYNALAGASDPALIKKTVAMAAESEEIERGELDRFLAQVASSSDNPDRVWELASACPYLTRIVEKLTPSKRQRLLPQIARASSSPLVAFQLKWADQSRDSTGARYEADKAAEQIETKVDFTKLLVPAMDAWLSANRGN